MTTNILGDITNPSMSEKKSSIKNENTCTLCNVKTDDFLELEDFSDNGFILCAHCEAMSECKDLYGAYNIGYIDAHSRKGFSIYRLNPRITETIASIKTNFSPEEINAK